MTASVYQMLRGAEILFSALFAVLFLKRKLNRLHYGGVVCCMVRATPVAACSSSHTSANLPDTSRGLLIYSVGVVTVRRRTARSRVSIAGAGGHLNGGRQQPAVKGRQQLQPGLRRWDGHARHGPHRLCAGMATDTWTRTTWCHAVLVSLAWPSLVMHGMPPPV